MRELSPDTNLAHYRIVSKIGTGGMGEVYLAQDTKLDRKVALKILPTEVASNKQRMHRFKQEARTASSLNHPNVAHVYEIGQVSGTSFIAMEFVDGLTLREHALSAPLTIIEVLGIAIQLADALQSAHEVGIVHRDVKPENIMVRRRDGYIKVLDFGLAKLTGHQVASGDTATPTKTLIKTGPGLVMGTLQYMSPEQARGLELDARTDIWSIGCVIYEMLANRPPFGRDRSSDVLVAILEKEAAPLARYMREVPETLEWIVSKALRKNREERYQTAKEMLVDLRSLKQRLEFADEQERAMSPESKPSSKPVTSEIEQALGGDGKQEAGIKTAEAARPTTSVEYLLDQAKRHKLTVALFLVVATVGVVTVFKYARRSVKKVPFATMKVTRLTTSGRASLATVSPDGKYVVHVTGNAGEQGLQLRHIDTGSDKEIVPPGKEPYSALTFSHDGSYIYYVKYYPEGGVLFQVPVLGGTPRILKKDVDGVPTFSPDGKQYAFIRGLPHEAKDALIVASMDGGNERKLVTHNAWDLFPRSSKSSWGPAWSPDGTLIAFPLKASAENGDEYRRVMLARVSDGRETPLTSNKWSSITQIGWMPDGTGMIIAAADREEGSPHQLWHVSYPDGELQRITNDLNNYDGVSLTSDAAALVTVQTERRVSIWVAPNGEASRATEIPSDKNDGLFGLAWTPEGRIVYSSTKSGNQDIWIMDADGNNRKQLTVSDTSDTRPTVSPDGRYIIFVSNRAADSNIWRMDADGGNPKQLTTRLSYRSCSLNNQWIIYTSDQSGRQQLWKVSIDGGAPVPVTEYDASRPVLSPDGNYIALAYISKNSYKPAVMLFAGGPPFKTFEFPLLIEPQMVRWTADSRALTYLVTSGGVSNIWEQALDGGPPVPLTRFNAEMIFAYDWSRDGNWLTLARGSEESDAILISESK